MRNIFSFHRIRRFFIDRFRFIGQSSSVHGLKWVFEKGSNTLCRMFWLFIVLISTGCLYLLLMPVVLEKNHVSFTPDTLYLDWTTVFPAVTVCETYNSKMAQRKFAERYPNLTDALNFDYRRYLTDLAYGRGSCSRSVCKPCGDKIPCDLPWSNIVRDENNRDRNLYVLGSKEGVRISCAELLSTCTFNTGNFSCCKEFLNVDSEYGPCYAFNSLQSRDAGRKTLFVVNRKTGPGVLSFRLISDAQISIHSTEELSTNILDTKFKFDVRTQMADRVDILFSLKEVENEPRVRLEDVEVRKCRYTDEIPQAPLHSYPVYSYGACRLARSTEQAFKYCGCIQPVRDLSYSDKYCNYTGLNCLVTYEANKTKLGIETDRDIEDCWPSCEESELTVIHISKRQEFKYQREGTTVNIRMSSLPTMRYQKKLLRSNLDLVVSVGGMVGLFFGASILSIVEILYLMIRIPSNISQ